MNKFLIFLIPFTAVFFNQLSTASELTHCPGSKETSTFSTPKGWTRDFKNAQKLGLCVAYYPVNFNWHTTPVVLYPNIVPAYKSLSESINKDVQKFKKKKPDIKIVSKSLELKNKSSVYKEFLNGPKPNKFEGVIYTPIKKDILMTTLLSNTTEKHFRHYQPVLKSFAESTSTQSNKLFFKKLQKSSNRFKEKNSSLYNSVIRSFLPLFYSSIKKCNVKSQKTSVILFFDKTQTLRNVFFESQFNQCLRNAMIGNKTVKSNLKEFYVSIDLNITQKDHKKTKDL